MAEKYIYYYTIYTIQVKYYLNANRIVPVETSLLKLHIVVFFEELIITDKVEVSDRIFLCLQEVKYEPGFS